MYFIEKFALHARWSIPHAEHTEPEFVLLLATPGFKPSCKSFNLRQILEQYHYAILEKIELALGFLNDEDAGAETWTAAILGLAKRSSFNLVAFSVQQQYEYDIEILDMLRQLSSINSIEQLRLMSAPANKFPLSDRMMELLTIEVHGDKEEQKEHFRMLNWFSYNGHISFSIASVSSMLESRMKYQMKRAQQPEMQNFPLQIHIGYHSRKWFKRKHPNDAKSFYKFIEEFSTDGRCFHLYASLNPMDSSE